MFAKLQASPAVIRLAVRVDRAHAEIVLAELIELAPSGVEETDVGDAVEYAIYGAPGELPELPDVEAAAGGALVVGDDRRRSRTTGPTAGARSTTPLVVGDRLAVRPPWEDADRGRRARPRHRPRPGLRHRRPRDDAAVPRGAARARARRPAARPRLRLRGARDRRREARVRPRLRHGLRPARRRGDARPTRRSTASSSTSRGPTCAPTGCPPVPTVVAEPAAPVAARLRRAGWPPASSRCRGRSIASGLLVDEVDAVVAAFAPCGLAELERAEDGEWAFVRLVTTTHP